MLSVCSIYIWLHAVLDFRSVMTAVLNVFKKSVIQFIQSLLQSDYSLWSWASSYVLWGRDDLHGSALDGLNCVALLARQ